MNSEKSLEIGSKIQEYSKTVGSDQYLSYLLTQLKNKEEGLSSNSSRDFKNLAMNLVSRCEFDKEFEVLNRKIGFQNFTDKKKEKEDEIEEAKKEIERIKQETIDIKNKWELEKRPDGKFDSEEIKQYKAAIKEKANKIAEINNDIESSQKYCRENKVTQGDIDEFEEKLNDKINEVFLKKQQKNSAERDHLKSLEAVKIYESLEDRVAELKQHEAGLVQNVKFWENVHMEGALADQEEILNSLSTKITELNEKLEVGENSLNILNQEYEELHSQSTEKMKKLFMSRLASLISSSLDTAFKRWKWFADEEPEVLDEEDEIILHDVEDTAVIEEEAIYLLENNAILNSLREANLSNEKPMPPANMFKFLEELMNSKIKVDLKDIADGRRPRLMTEFLIEHLTRVFGIPKLALKNLAQLIPALQQQLAEGNSYGTFYCRLLQIYHPQPIPFYLALYLVKVRGDFCVMNDRYEKIKIALEHKTGKKVVVKKGEALEYAASGGLAYLTDVFEYIYRAFAGDREGGTLALELMKPKNIPIEELVAYKLTHKMAKLGKTPEGLYGLLDKNGDCAINCIEFIKGCRTILDLWVTPDGIKKFFEKLDIYNEGKFRKETFLSMVNMKAFTNQNKSGKYVISKSSFLNALTEVFMIRQRRDAAFIMNIVGRYDYLEPSQFESEARKIDRTITQQKMAQLIREASEISSERPRITPKAFARSLIRNGIGKWGLKSFKVCDIPDNTIPTIEMIINENEKKGE